MKREALSPGTAVALQVQRLANLLRRSASATYGRELGLSTVEWRVVARLGEFPEPTLNDLSVRMTYDAGQLSRVVSRLVSAGLVERKKESGRRGFLLALTVAGAEVYERLAEFSELRNERLLQGVDEADRAVFSRVLEAVTGNARALIPPDRAAEASDQDD